MKKCFLLIIMIGSVFSCDDIIEVVDISNEKVTILAPKDEVVLNITDIAFSWETLEDAESYHVQVATPTFNEATQIVLDTVVTKTEVSKTLNNNNYEWRIKARNSGYETVYTTQGFSVTD